MVILASIMIRTRDHRSIEQVRDKPSNNFDVWMREGAHHTLRGCAHVTADPRAVDHWRESSDLDLLRGRSGLTSIGASNSSNGSPLAEALSNEGPRVRKSHCTAAIAPCYEHCGQRRFKLWRLKTEASLCEKKLLHVHV